MLPSARNLALNIIVRTLRGEHVQAVMDNVYGKMHPAEKERLRCTDIVYGYLRAKARIDFILAKVLKNPGKLPKFMPLMLGIGIYCMIFQDKIPDYAVVDGIVRETGKKYGKKLAAVANGVLRSVQRLGQNLVEPAWYETKDTQDDNAAGDSIFYSIPPYIEKLWKTSYGDETAHKLMSRSFERPWKGLRVNFTHPMAPSFYDSLKNLGGTGIVEICRGAFAMAPGFRLPNFMEHDFAWWHARGLFSWQAAGSMLVLDKLGIFDWEEPLWDCCAGVGGKTAALMERGINVELASDTSLKRLKNLAVQCARLDIPAPPTALIDAAHPPVKCWRGNILVDVPCSGLGVLARRPDIKNFAGDWRKALKTLATVQSDILAAMGSILHENGRLAYITCTISPPENEDMVENFLKKEQGFELLSSWHTPFEHPWLEGMFGAVIRKK